MYPCPGYWAPGRRLPVSSARGVGSLIVYTGCDSDSCCLLHTFDARCGGGWVCETVVVPQPIGVAVSAVFHAALVPALRWMLCNPAVSADAM
jgi:hypothetical protein